MVQCFSSPKSPWHAWHGTSCRLEHLYLFIIIIIIMLGMVQLQCCNAMRPLQQTWHGTAALAQLLRDHCHHAKHATLHQGHHAMLLFLQHAGMGTLQASLLQHRAFRFCLTMLSIKQRSTVTCRQLCHGAGQGQEISTPYSHHNHHIHHNRHNHHNHQHMQHVCKRFHHQLQPDWPAAVTAPDSFPSLYLHTPIMSFPVAWLKPNPW